ncbi:MAG: type I pantothenate kinase, partial [Alphaproteobacteria bacterium]|nr:type I pantothenate kinase [Alphaproteobacteria bacterium]
PDTTLTLTEVELAVLRGRGETISLAEVEEVYWPLSRLLSFYVEATKNLSYASDVFFGRDTKTPPSSAPASKVPFIIGIAGSVAVGKSTSSRILQALLARWHVDGKTKVDLITTDGFLYPNAILEKRNLMDKKGFPESFDLKHLRRFLAEVKSGAARVCAPVYSHNSYDIVAGEEAVIESPDILIVEGLNVLQPARLIKADRAPINKTGIDNDEIPFVSDFFDFSIYIDANAAHIKEWYVSRFMSLRRTAFLEPDAYFRRYADVSEAKARQTAEDIWTRINYANLCENILPTRGRANLILHKERDHRVNKVLLRKI